MTRALVVDATLPSPRGDGGEVRAFQLVTSLARQGAAVTVAAVMPGGPGRVEALERAGCRAEPPPEGASPGEGLEAARALVRARAPRADLVVLARPQVMEALAPEVRAHAPGARLVYDTVDLHHLREYREASYFRDRRRLRVALARRAQERRLAAAADLTLAITPAEAAALRALAPDALVGVLGFVQPALIGPRDPPPGARLVFLGSWTHAPNHEAGRILLAEVLPALRALDLRVEVDLVGAAPPRELTDLASEGVRFLGWVEDLGEALASARALVAPLPFGAGLKVKVLTALAHGLPVVTTPVGVEGMDLAHQRDVLVAEDPSGLAGQVARLLRDDGLWTQVSGGGREALARSYSPEVFDGQVAALLDGPASA